MDRFSPCAAVHIRVLVIPIGRVERRTYVDVLHRLQTEVAIIHHSALSSLVGDDDFALSPKRFEPGCLLFNYTSSAPDEHALQYSPYELSRETLLVIGVASANLSHQSDGKDSRASAEYLREKHSRAVHRKVLLLHDGDDVAKALEGEIVVTQPLEAGTSSLHSAMNQVALRFLRELTIYAQAMQASPSIPTPGQASKTLQRMSWLRDADGRPGSGSGFGTPLGSPTGEEGPSRSTSRSRASPATSFDQIAGANTAPSALSRSDSNSKKHSRNASHDRIISSGPGISQEKIKKRGRARVGIVSGTIYMLAGLWSEALQLLVENTTQARSLHDPLWHAKGLENIIACLMLHAWQGVDFQLPQLCYPTAERTSSLPGAHRFSLSLPSGSSRTGDMADSASVHRLAGMLPDLVKQVVMLYRSNEGSAELDTLLLYEATIRLTKLLAITSTHREELSKSVLTQIVGATSSSGLQNIVKTGQGDSSPLESHFSRPGANAAVVELLSAALPNNDDGISTSDHLVILAGIASVYSTLGMQRKKAITMKELVIRLTAALNHARKLGAAEMGIHPAASLSTETGIVASPHESKSILNMIREIARVYGIHVAQPAVEDSTDSELAKVSTVKDMEFGSNHIKIATLKELLALCEAAPDPHGILRVLASFMRLASPNSAVDLTSRGPGIDLAPEEQSRLANMMSRTMGVARHLGLQVTQVEYWDPHMLRALTFAPASMQRLLIDRTKMGRAATGTGANPLLYDPNSSRQATAQQNILLVEGESTTCLLTLQNTLDVAIEIEWIQLVTDSAALETIPKSVKLGAACIQQVALQVTPTAIGKVVVKACKIKVLGCYARDFALVASPWAPARSLLTKPFHSVGKADDRDRPPTSTIPLEVVAAMPVLEVAGTSLQEDTLGVLEGERQSFEITVRNTSDTDATIVEAICSSLCFRIASSNEMIVREGTITLTAELVGESDVPNLRVDIFYSRASGSDTYARLLSLPILATVSATLQTQDLDISASPTHDEVFNVSFTLTNRYRSDITYICSTLHDSNWSDQATSTLSTAQSHRVHLTVSQWNPVYSPDSTPEDLLTQLLSRVRVNWQCGARKGVTSLTYLTLPPSAAALIHGNSTAISIAPLVERLAPGTFATLTVNLRNRTTSPTGALYIQLHPYTDSVDTAVVVGSLTRLVPALKAGEEREVKFSICPLLAGKLEMRASLRPALAGKMEQVDTKGESWSRKMSLVVG